MEEEHAASLELHRKESSEQVQQLQARVKSLTAELMRQRNTEHARMTDLEAQLRGEHGALSAEREEKMAALSAENRALAGEVGKLRLRVEDAELQAHESMELKRRAQAAAAERDEERQMEIKKLRETLDAKEKESVIRAAEHEAMSRRIAGAEEEVRAQMRSAQTLTGEIERLRQAVDASAEAVKRGHAVAQQLEAQVASKEQEIEAVRGAHRAELAKWKELLDGVMQQVTSDRADWDAEKTLWAQMRSDADSRVHAAEEENRLLRNELMEWLTKVKEMEAAANDAASRENAATKLTGELEAKIADGEREIARMQALSTEQEGRLAVAENEWRARLQQEERKVRGWCITRDSVSRAAINRAAINRERILHG